MPAGDRPRDEHGDFAEEYSTRRYLRALRRIEPASTGEVANEVGCHRNNARERLKDLEKEGRVEKDKIGGAFIWRTI